VSRVKKASETVAVNESFDRKSGGYPKGWSQWRSGRDISLSLSSAKSLSAPQSLTVSGSSRAAARAWLKGQKPADVQVTAAVFLDTVIPALVLLRGERLNTATPSYYGATVARGLEVKLVRVVKGKVTDLATLKSAGYLSYKWVRVTLLARGNQVRVRVFRTDTSQYLGSSGQWEAAASWALTRTDKEITGKGLVGLGRAAGYNGTLYFDDFAVAPPPAEEKGAVADTAPAPAEEKVIPLPRPDIPRHFKHIRVAMLAYSGNPMGAFEDRLLRKGVDLVVPNARYMKHIKAVAPKTPQLIYTNTSNLYLDLLTDWLAFADAKGISREAAFYHAAKATPFRGDSPSSRPVTWFWAVLRGGRGLDDLTKAAHGTSGRLEFGSGGDSLYLGYPDRFREINLRLAAGARGGWSAVLEYVKAVDGHGKPTRWGKLRLKTDTTSRLRKSGRLTFDPPADWKAARVGSKARLLYVRFRGTGRGEGPVARSILGRDYVRAKGKTTGVVPAFDFKADANHDGYLDDAEYARRTSGMDARFVYESRMFTESYGQMRYSTNPASAGFRRWTVRYHKRLLKRYPLAAGLFMDNCDGKPPVVPGQSVESVARYAQDNGAMLGALSRALAPRWVLANSSDQVRADPVVRHNPAYMLEFAIRPLAHNYVFFESLAATVARRAKLASPPPVAVIDSHPQQGKLTGTRMKLATLAYYYLLSDPDSTFLMLYGGFEPNSPWKRHWLGAVAFDIGKPAGGFSEWASGTDPSNAKLNYRVYQRAFGKALVLYKPLSYAKGMWGVKPALGKESATKHALRGTYRPLRADGTLGPPVTTVTLRNGEGAILIKSGKGRGPGSRRTPYKRGYPGPRRTRPAGGTSPGRKTGTPNKPKKRDK
jgi:hypothetical protein